MKKFLLVVNFSIALQLIGCNDNIHNNTPLLENSRGITTNCLGDVLYRENDTTSKAADFWKANNFHKGTNEFVCKDGKPYLPNQVTDCQGNVISQQAGGMAKFLQTNHLEYWATIKFVCQNGKPVQWQNKSD